MPRSRSSVELAYIFLRRFPRWYANQRSLRQSPGGSIALWCHCSMRWVLVKEPSFSVCAAAGKKNTSVWMSSVRTSPRAISGASRQNSAVSVGAKSRTTTHRRVLAHEEVANLVAVRLVRHGGHVGVVSGEPRQVVIGPAVLLSGVLPE